MTLIDIETATYEEMLQECAHFGSDARQELKDRVALIQEMERGGTKEEALARIADRRKRWGKG